MRFEFKGLSSFEEDAACDYMGDANIPSVIREFDNISSAISYINAHQGFMTTDDNTFAFVVRNIKQVNN